MYSLVVVFSHCTSILSYKCRWVPSFIFWSRGFMFGTKKNAKKTWSLEACFTWSKKLIVSKVSQGGQKCPKDLILRGSWGPKLNLRGVTAQKPKKTLFLVTHFRPIWAKCLTRFNSFEWVIITVETQYFFKWKPIK